jgi:polyphosphate kinase
VARAVTAQVTDDARLLNRELSWLDYDARVLARAADPSLPVLERSRSCAYFSSNLDEFFMVRVAGLAKRSQQVFMRSARARARRSSTNRTR